MLKQRVITAAVLFVFLMAALSAPRTWPFALLLVIVIGAAGWEWARLNAAGPRAVPLGVLLAGAAALAFWAGWGDQPPRLAWALATAVWTAGGALVLRAGVTSWPRIATPVRWAAGLALLWTAWLALVHARSIGINFLLSVFALVWAADIAAYFGGRAFGRKKLAPSISPGKSWAGVWSGLAGALLLALVWYAFDRSMKTDSESLYTRLDGRFGIAGVAVGVAFLVSMSIVGDLFESLVKRSAGAKDSSQLLPGHGGVLDRIDGLLPVFPIALALIAL